MCVNVIARKTQGCVTLSCCHISLRLSLRGCLQTVDSWWAIIINIRLCCQSSYTAPVRIVADLTRLVSYIAIFELKWDVKLQLTNLTRPSHALTSLGRLLWSGSQMSVRTSTKSFLDFNYIWYVGRGRWVMHVSVQYDLIQGQGHEPLKVGNLTIFKSYLSSPIYNGGWQTTTGS